MKKLTRLLLLFGAFQSVQAQTNERPFEFGSTLVTVNSFHPNYFAPQRAPAEFINGLFFRYTKNRLGIRAHTSYSDYSAVYMSPAGIEDGEAGDIHHRDFRIGVGGQFSVLKHKDWLYTFLDASYRNLFTTGHRYGGVAGRNERYNRSSNGLDAGLGMGFKIKTLKHIFLSPEIGWLTAYTSGDETKTHLVSGKSSSYKNNNLDISLTIKLQLTVRF